LVPQLFGQNLSSQTTKYHEETTFGIL